MSTVGRPMMEGPCDFYYLRGSNKNRICNLNGWEDSVGFRCAKHRRSNVKTWNKLKHKGDAPLRLKYEQIAQVIHKIRDLFKDISALAEVIVPSSKLDTAIKLNIKPTPHYF